MPFARSPHLEPVPDRPDSPPSRDFAFTLVVTRGLDDVMDLEFPFREE